MTEIQELENQIIGLKEKVERLSEVVEENKCKCNSSSAVFGSSRFCKSASGTIKYRKITASYKKIEDDVAKDIVEETYSEDSRDKFSSAKDRHRLGGSLENKEEELDINSQEKGDNK